MVNILLVLYYFTEFNLALVYLHMKAGSIEPLLIWFNHCYEIGLRGRVRYIQSRLFAVDLWAGLAYES